MRNKSRMLAVSILSGLAVIALSGCAEQTMLYQGVERPVSEVEEILSDTLEVENPSLDLNVNITQDTED